MHLGLVKSVAIAFISTIKFAAFLSHNSRVAKAEPKGKGQLCDHSILFQRCPAWQ